MVRLVFRPYTQLRRSICTSESLRPSIRISPDFGLTRHSSPSFGSIHLYSACSQRAGSIGNGGNAATREQRLPSDRQAALCFHCAYRFSQPIDSYTCKTPWSVFQDGSKPPPTYSAGGKADRNKTCCSLYESAASLSGPEPGAGS